MYVSKIRNKQIVCFNEGKAQCDFHLDTCKDGEGAAAKDGVLQNSGDVLVPGLHQADRLAEGEGQGARSVMVLEVVADWKVSVNRNAVL